MVGGAPGVAVLLCRRLDIQEGGCGGWSFWCGGSESKLGKGLRAQDGGRMEFGTKGSAKSRFVVREGVS